MALSKENIEKLEAIKAKLIKENVKDIDAAELSEQIKRKSSKEYLIK